MLENQAGIIHQDEAFYFPYHEWDFYFTAHPLQMLVKIQIFRDKTSLPGGCCLAVQL